MQISECHAEPVTPQGVAVSKHLALLFLQRDSLQRITPAKEAGARSF
jgi:hypothetical protein